MPLFALIVKSNLSNFFATKITMSTKQSGENTNGGEAEGAKQRSRPELAQIRAEIKRVQAIRRAQIREEIERLHAANKALKTNKDAFKYRAVNRCLEELRELKRWGWVRCEARRLELY